MTNNQRFNKIRWINNNEFYTQLSDIEEELIHYHKYFQDKVVYCNCDDHQTSNFVKYFKSNFNSLGLKKLISTNYVDRQSDLFNGHKIPRPVRFEYDGLKTCVEPLTGDGDFRSGESIELLRRSDIVVTNPPFSLFREYLDQLIEHQKQFLIIGPLTSLTYIELFNLIKVGKFCLGYKPWSKTMVFDIPHKKQKDIGAIWLTTLDPNRDQKEIVLTKKYTPGEYPYYDNYNAINVNKTCDIPMDYTGLMGVPISFFDKYNQNQFELIDLKERPRINKRILFYRVIVKNKRPV